MISFGHIIAKSVMDIEEVCRFLFKEYKIDKKTNNIQGQFYEEFDLQLLDSHHDEIFGFYDEKTGLTKEVQCNSKNVVCHLNCEKRTIDCNVECLANMTLQIREADGNNGIYYECTENGVFMISHSCSYAADDFIDEDWSNADKLSNFCKLIKKYKCEGRIKNEKITMVDGYITDHELF